MRCEICYETHDDGVGCSSHSICRECGGRWLSSMATDAGLVRKRCSESWLGCPAVGCGGRLPFEAFESFDEYPGFLETAKRVWQTRRDELIECLNLRCPKCAILLDPDAEACAAMTCSYCGTFFCYACLKRSRSQQEAHAHVPLAHGCESAYVPRDALIAEQNKLRRKALHACLRDQDAEFRPDLIAAIQQDLDHLGITLDPDEIDKVLEKPASTRSVSEPKDSKYRGSSVTQRTHPRGKEMKRHRRDDDSDSDDDDDDDDDDDPPVLPPPTEQKSQLREDDDDDDDEDDAGGDDESSVASRSLTSSDAARPGKRILAAACRGNWTAFRQLATEYGTIAKEMGTGAFPLFEERDELGRPALQHVVFNSPDPRRDLALAFKFGCRVDQPQEHGWRPLHLAVWKRDIDLIAALVDDFKADLNAKIPGDGKTALMLATAADDLDSMKALLDRGADPAAVDDNGRTALAHAFDDDDDDSVDDLDDDEERLSEENDLVPQQPLDEGGPPQNARMLLAEVFDRQHGEQNEFLPEDLDDDDHEAAGPLRRRRGGTLHDEDEKDDDVDGSLDDFDDHFDDDDDDDDDDVLRDFEEDDMDMDDHDDIVEEILDDDDDNVPPLDLERERRRHHRQEDHHRGTNHRRRRLVQPPVGRQNGGLMLISRTQKTRRSLEERRRKKQERRLEVTAKKVTLYLKYPTGALWKVRDKLQDTALHQVIKCCHVDSQATILEMLIDGGAAVDATGELDWRPLHLAAWFRAHRAVRVLLKRGARVDGRCGPRAGVLNNTPLHLCAGGSATSFKDFLNHSAPHDVENVLETLVALLEHGGDFQATNQRGQTPLQYAREEAVLAGLDRRDRLMLKTSHAAVDKVLDSPDPVAAAKRALAIHKEKRLLSKKVANITAADDKKKSVVDIGGRDPAASKKVRRRRLLDDDPTVQDPVAPKLWVVSRSTLASVAVVAAFLGGLLIGKLC